MNEDNQGNKPDALENVPMKRKRGRPRKYPRPNVIHGDNPNLTRDRNRNPGESAGVPPGFQALNGNQLRRVEPNDGPSGVMVGQPVYGVVEAAFDAGYLLTVRIGNSETTLRGVVFKPGHYVPVSAENDVAPNIQMIRRNEVPFPAGHSNRGSNPQPRDRNGHVNTHRNGVAHPSSEPPAVNQVAKGLSPTSNQAVSKGKVVSTMVTQIAHPAMSRVNLVPVVLQPVNLSNGQPVSNQPSKDSTQAVHTLNGSIPTNPVSPGASEPQTSQQVMAKAPESLASLCDQTQILQEAEAASMRLPGMPFEKLLSEVIKRIQVPSQSAENDKGNINLADKALAKETGHASKGDATEVDQALSIEPLQALQPDLSKSSASVSGPLENQRTGKMTELLQVVQENMMADQVTQGERQSQVPN